MKATIKKIGIKHITTKTGVKFDKIVIDCDVVMNDKNEVRTYTAEMSCDYAKRYFNYCGVSSKEAIGRPCDVTLRKREYTKSDGTTGVWTDIKWFNLLDSEGNAIILRKQEMPGEEVPF